MNILKKLGLFTLGLASLYIAYITGTGDILNYINFADPLNELAFCVCSLLFGVGSIFFAFTKTEIKVHCSKELDNQYYNESI